MALSVEKKKMFWCNRRETTITKIS